MQHSFEMFSGDAQPVLYSTCAFSLSEAMATHCIHWDGPLRWGRMNLCATTSRFFIRFTEAQESSEKTSLSVNGVVSNGRRMSKLTKMFHNMKTTAADGSTENDSLWECDSSTLCLKHFAIQLLLHIYIQMATWFDLGAFILNDFIFPNSFTSLCHEAFQ